MRRLGQRRQNRILPNTTFLAHGVRHGLDAPLGVDGGDKPPDTKPPVVARGRGRGKSAPSAASGAPSDPVLNLSELLAAARENVGAGDGEDKVKLKAEPE